MSTRRSSKASQQQSEEEEEEEEEEEDEDSEGESNSRSARNTKAKRARQRQHKTEANERKAVVATPYTRPKTRTTRRKLLCCDFCNTRDMTKYCPQNISWFRSVPDAASGL